MKVQVQRLIIIICIFCSLPTPVRSQYFENTDRIFSEYIKTVRLYPVMNSPRQEFMPAAAPLNREFMLMLEFDDLFAEYERYYIKFIHCNADWSPSGLFALDYLEVYNEFLIENYDFSFNTKVPYLHYNFILPRFKISGNYLLVVYRESEENVILSKRFVMYDNQVIIKGEYDAIGMVTVSRMTQEIQFSLDYQRTDFNNPRRNIKATIKQNQRWSNAIYGLEPTFVRESSRVIDFKHFALENRFHGGNQFRFFDLRSLEYYGRNVDKVDIHKEVPQATLEIDKPRKGKAYSDYHDNNGKYLISHPTESDYAYVEFFIETERLSGNVYVTGDLSNWEITNDFRMEYQQNRKGYYKSILLKQGFYDYQYWVESTELQANYLEGDHFETENEYEILVYYYSFELNTDLLIGYFILTRNPGY